MNTCVERLKNGIITENPTFVMMLGMCPTLAVTTPPLRDWAWTYDNSSACVIQCVYLTAS